MALLATGLHSCKEAPKPLQIDNSLTAEERAAGRLTPEVMWKMGRIGSTALSPDGEWLLYTLTRYSMEENRGAGVIVLQSMADGTSRELTDLNATAAMPSWSADGKYIWYLSNRGGDMQIWRMDADGGAAVQVSAVDGGVESYGVAPDGCNLFYTKRVHVKDMRSSDLYKDMDKSKARIYDDLMCRHWDYWDEGDYSHIFVAAIDGDRLGAGMDIMSGEAWDAPLAPYFDSAEIAWSPDSKHLAYTCKPLTGAEYAVSTDSDVYIYTIQSGEKVNICKTGGADSMPGYDKYPVWSPDGENIAFRSQRRAGNEADKESLFVYNRTSGKMRDLTAAFDYHATNVVWEDDDTLLFIAPMQATLQICRVGLDGGGVQVLTSGDHDINAFTLAGGKCVASMTKITHATELFDVNTADGALMQITAVNSEIYDNVTMGEVQKRWVRTTDGKQMLVWVILPPDFDPSQKYPTLLYCQGGPQSVVSQFWSYRWNFQLMAAQGYVVVAPNRRGLPSFGQEWLDQISGDYSGQNIRDYLAAIDDVAREPWADEERLGCVGASYGGYSVYFLAGHHNKRFKAFIAHCGIFDFDSMYGHTEELWFVNNDYGGPYWDKSNATAMRSYANSPHKFVDRWDTPILIITGEKDYRIPYTQSLEAFTAARMRDIPSRLVSFENEAHQVFQPQNSLVWNREFFGWLETYL